MKYIVFLTKNNKSTINGINRILIGVHKTENPDIFDGYLGEGVRVNKASTFMYPKTSFQYAVKKYGVKSFERITLYIYDTLKDAYNKYYEIVDDTFINASYTYNTKIYKKYAGTCDYRPIYQFNLKGELVKEWECIDDVCDFYCYPKWRFCYARASHTPLLNFYWSGTKVLNIVNPDDKSHPVHMYNKDGKLVFSFGSYPDFGEFINANIKEMNDIIYKHRFINGYYPSNKLLESFAPKARRKYLKEYMYVYNKEGDFIGKFFGKEVMTPIGTHSWKKIEYSIEHNDGWFNDFYISLNEIDIVPEKKEKITYIEVFDKFGNFIEKIDTIKEVKEKYGITSGKINRIKLGQKHWGDYIFVYNRK